MRVTLNGHEYSVIWRYNDIPTQDGLHVSRETRCIIRRDDEELVSIGVKCHFRDPFCKNCGRKEAMSRAIASIKDHEFPLKDERRAFWQTYAEMRHGKYD